MFDGAETVLVGISLTSLGPNYSFSFRKSRRKLEPYLVVLNVPRDTGAQSPRSAFLESYRPSVNGWLAGTGIEGVRSTI